MAYVKRIKRDGTQLIGYRPTPAAPAKFIVIAGSRDVFERLCLAERHAKRKGEEFDPKAFEYVAAPLSVASKKARNMSVTLQAWIGSPKSGAEGDFFTFAGSTTGKRRAFYEATLKRWVYPHLVDEKNQPLAMSEVGRREIVRLVSAWLACQECRTRAEAAGLDPASIDLRVTTSPWDQRCVDSDGDSTHYPAIRRSTMQGYLGTLGTAFKVGVTCGEEDSVCDANPVLGYSVPMFADRPTDEAQALSFDELDCFEATMPDQLAVTVAMSAYGLLRRSEVFGANRSDFDWPVASADDDGDEVGIFHLARVFVRGDDGTFVLRPWGKTPGSTFPVPLPSRAMERIRRHFNEHRSTPHPDRCRACADQLGEFSGRRGTNPHRNCDFADDAPVFVDVTGKRFDPDTFTKEVVPAVVAAASLTREFIGFDVTHKVLRATGATLLSELGVPDDVIDRIGRWAPGSRTRKKHYSKVRDRSRVEAVQLFERAAEASQGRPLPDDATVEDKLRWSQAQAERLSTEVQRLRALLEDRGEVASVEPRARISLRLPRVSIFNDRCALEAALEGASSQKECLEALGLSIAGKHYQALRAACHEFGLVLPHRYDSLRTRRTSPRM